ncbi:MAG: hypothetical protein NZ902_02375 [Acidilobaceae archaeon]|nr:hypothetical protein [Acidilobaceae archaeon]MCX8165665.1 hypothetical protein [Acidilobaceae archaeon]MDW7974090.1 hypothetical protein [Sulfolobales archaeon]
MLEDVYYEFIAFPCGVRLSSPLGIFGRSFKVYKGTSLWRALPRASRLLLLSPLDPLAFYDSVRHELELRVEWEECPRPHERLGAWYSCMPRLLERGELYDVYRCEEFAHIGGTPPPYSRVMGCLVELLVLLTKARVGAVKGYLEYARWLTWCVERASRGGRYAEVARLVLQELEALEGEGKEAGGPVL